jgi:hypothetical protein
MVTGIGFLDPKMWGGLHWQKASASQGNSNCVELAELPNSWVALRNSREPNGLRLVFNKDQLLTLLQGLSLLQLNQGEGTVTISHSDGSLLTFPDISTLSQGLSFLRIGREEGFAICNPFDPDKPSVPFTIGEICAFLIGVRDGEFNHFTA